MTCYKKSQNKYKKKITQFKVQYSLNDEQEGRRIKAYLAQTGQSTNSYIKGLIKANLDNKGFEYQETKSGHK